MDMTSSDFKFQYDDDYGGHSEAPVVRNNKLQRLRGRVTVL
ncbi:MAG: hypothetical protein ACI9W4_000495 [Rhodothermales bacterium]|jgi:hypothetical protein